MAKNNILKFILFLIFILLFINTIFLKTALLGLPLTIAYFIICSLVLKNFFQDKILNLFFIIYLISLGMA
ncbi:MAG: hypothetical protein ACPLYC_01470, partial [Minisyncoccia bacterium]